MAPARGARRRSVAITLALTYAAVVVGWHVLHLRGSSFWPFALGDIFGVWLYAPLPLLGLIGGLARSRSSCVLLGVPLFVFGLEYGPLVLPHGRDAAGVPVRVVTANLLIVNGSYDAVADALLEQRADVLAVQELGPGMAERLAVRSAERYPYQALSASRGTTGMGIFSRFPIQSAERPEMEPGQCACQLVVLEVDGRPFSVINVHPTIPTIAWRAFGYLPLPSGFDTRAQEPSVEQILEKARWVDTPLILLGDFNIADRQPLYRAFASRFRDAYRESGTGFGLSFPARALWLPLPALIRIDYVFHDERWSSARSWTGTIPGSDHRLVGSELVLRS